MTAARQQQLPTNAQKLGARAIVAASAGLKCPLRPVIAARKCASRWHPTAAMAVARRWCSQTKQGQPARQCMGRARRQAQRPLVQITHARSEQHGGARNPQIHRQGQGEGRAGLLLLGGHAGVRVGRWHPCIGRSEPRQQARRPQAATRSRVPQRPTLTPPDEAALCAYMVAR